MKKIMSLLVFFMIILLSSLSYSATDDMTSANITINFPTDLTYNFSTGSTPLPRLNATVRWNANTKNITNVSFIFTSGTTRFVFTNTTMNGTGGAIAGNQNGSFTYTINANNLTANLAYTVRVEIRNSTELGNDAAVNSSAITYTLDSINPSITIQQPAQGETVSAKGTGIFLIDYTPTDTNLGNATYYIEGIPQTSSTSGTTSPNLTSGSRKNTFTKFFGTNNDSIDLIIEITDLAGGKTNSSTTTFNVFVAGSPEPVKVFVTPEGKVISVPTEPKGKAITKPISFGNIGNAGSLLSNPLVWGGAIIVAVGLFIWWQNRKK